MKGGHWFIVGILAFLLLMFAVEYHLPKKFVWSPTFSHNDHQPFGCAVFDSILVTTLPSGYSVSKKTFYQLEQEDTVNNRGILVISNDFWKMDTLSTYSLLRMAARGNKIMLVGSSFREIMEDTLKFQSTYTSPSLRTFKDNILSIKIKKDSIIWVGNPKVYPRRTYQLYSHFCEPRFVNCDSLPLRRLVEKNMVGELEGALIDSEAERLYNNYHPLIAFARPWGKGEIIFVSNSLMFTNYGILDEQMSTYILRLLSQMKELPIVRSECYLEQTMAEKESPFRYFLSQRPLRWALYLTMLAILLFMMCTARRRQRVIPVVRQPGNKSLEFIELIGTLYFQKKDYADLVRKKYAYFAEDLRREIQVDINDMADDERSFHRIAQKTGMSVEEIRTFIREVRPLSYADCTISEQEMKKMIDKMNEITNKI